MSRPKFCTTCGKKLEERAVRVGYDEFTGRESGYVALRCPERSDRIGDTAHRSYSEGWFGRWRSEDEEP